MCGRCSYKMFKLRMENNVSTVASTNCATLKAHSAEQNTQMSEEMMCRVICVIEKTGVDLVKKGLIRFGSCKVSGYEHCRDMCRRYLQKREKMPYMSNYRCGCVFASAIAKL